MDETTPRKHPPFTVEIDVALHFKQKNISDTDAAAYKQKDGEQLVRLSSGYAVRTLVPHPHPYKVEFNAGAIDQILAERAAAKAMEPDHVKAGRNFSPIESWPFNRLVAKHLEMAAMSAHSPVEHWVAIRVKAAPTFDAIIKTLYGQSSTLEAFLQMYFDLPGEAE